MSHTPGPWTVDDDTLDILAVNIADAPAYIACQPAYPSGRPLAEEEITANLRLICAAPDLLRDLRAARDDIAAMASDSNGWREWDATAVDQLLGHRLLRLDGALRRAEGRE